MHVATRIMGQVWVSIHEPRQGVYGQFDIGNKAQMSRTAFWATLRCHDMMAEFTDHKFVEHHTVTAGMVHFLLLNNGFDKLNALQVENDKLKEDVKKLKEQVKEAGASVKTAMNKVTDFKSQVDGLVRRVKKLESSE